MFVPEMVQHFHDVKNRDVGVLDPEVIEDLMVGLMSFLEQLNEAGFARTQPARLPLTTRSSVTFLRHSAAPSGSWAWPWGYGCHCELRRLGECTFSGWTSRTCGYAASRLPDEPVAPGAAWSALSPVLPGARDLVMSAIVTRKATQAAPSA